MHSDHRFVPIRKATAAALQKAQNCLSFGRYEEAEALAAQALKDWRAAGAPREEESDLIAVLGKSLVAQRKYAEAYDLYMPALNYLTGSGYDEVYASFLYLNERMGTFSEPAERSSTASQADDGPPSYPSGYYDDFDKK